MADNTQTLACTYAALMLSDSGLPVSAQNISAAVKAAGIDVRPTLPIIFSRFLQKKPIESLLNAAAAVAPTVTEGAPAADANKGPAPAAGSGGDAGKAKKEEKVEEEDDDMGFGLFD